MHCLPHPSLVPSSPSPLSVLRNHVGVLEPFLFSSLSITVLLIMSFLCRLLQNIYLWSRLLPYILYGYMQLPAWYFLWLFNDISNSLCPKVNSYSILKPVSSLHLPVSIKDNPIWLRPKCSVTFDTFCLLQPISNLSAHPFDSAFKRMPTIQPLGTFLSLISFLFLFSFSVKHLLPSLITYLS